MCKGYFKISRDIFKHWIAENPEYLKWWLWLIANANWADGKKRPGSEPLKRGQLYVTQRYLQEEWARETTKPSHHTIWRFLSLLESEGMIKTEKHAHAATLVTVCNYDQYQDIDSPIDSPIGSPIGSPIDSPIGSPISKNTKASKEERIISPYQGLSELWNSVCLSLPKVQKLTPARKTKMKSRLEEWGVKSESEAAEFAERLFRKVQASDFLTGRTGGSRKWAASFDWLFENSANWVKVSEGNYDNDRGARQPASPAADPNAAQPRLGVGEYYAADGRRTYGSGRATIPPEAPPRPSERHAWNAAGGDWVMGI